jgi:mannitol-1-phosphate 5-dehydrogenase
MPEALIFGAGRIGRGFLGQLLHRSGYTLHFVDASATVVALLRRELRYRVDIAGRPEATEYVSVASAHTMESAGDVRPLVASADILVSAVGAASIASVARFVAPLLAAREGRPLDWLICENADQPARTLRETLLASADPSTRRYVDTSLGLVETQVLRTGMTADAATLRAEPLALRMQDWWTLPADADAFRAAPPAIGGLLLRGNFRHELVRKLYTFNGLNGPIAYVGYANGHRILHRAATDPRLEPLFRRIHEESAHGLLGEYGFDAAEHRQFQRIAWEKYRDPAIDDAIERNARDSARKLSPRERLVGPATLCLRHGRDPVAYATAIAAAIEYDGSDDPGTERVRAACARGGVPAVLVEHCGLAPDTPLARLVLDAHRRGDHRVGH